MLSAGAAEDLEKETELDCSPHKEAVRAHVQPEASHFGMSKKVGGDDSQPSQAGLLRVERLAQTEALVLQLLNSRQKQ